MGSIVAARPHPTVVRLEHLEAADATWIEEGYHITGEVRNHLDALTQALGRPEGCGAFLIGQFGSGKSHFLAFLTRRIEAGALVAPRPAVVTLSLLNYRAELPLEEILCQVLKLPRAEGDRRTVWATLRTRHPKGLVLIIDELSEFLRSKPSARAFNEDVRFLQFMGEWAQAERLWIVAAMQEQIEHTGELEYGLFQKIKDRFPIRLLLTATHVQELVRECVLVKKEGYEEAVGGIIAEIRQALPWSPVDDDQLRTLYPVHPATLALLEEIRDRFSQARGIVDFVVTRLAGDATRSIGRFLDEPLGSLLTPDLIVDHFRDQLELQSEFQPLAQQLLPYYRDHLEELFPKAPARQLANRLVKLLALVHLSPARAGLRAEEATAWLCYRVSRLDPAKNTAVVGKLLDQLADRGRYVTRSGDRYRLALDEDGGQELERRLQRELAELAERGDTVFEWVAPLLGNDAFNPLALPRDTWQSRSCRWHFHDRPYAVFLGNGAPPPREGLGLVIRLPWGNAEPAPAFATVVPAPLAASPAILELAALDRLRKRSWGTDAKRRLEARLTERLDVFRSQVRQSFQEARFVARGGETLHLPRLHTGMGLDAWLGAALQAVLRRSYPTFDRFPPSHGPLPAEVYRDLMRFLVERGLDDPGANEAVQLVREAYLVPMGLLQRRGREYVIPANLDRNELVRLITPLVDHQPAPKVLYEHLSGEGHGLVPDQVSLLLIVLLVAGEVDILKGRRSLRDIFETLPNPINYDRVVPGSALALEEIRDLQMLGEGLGLKSPKQWTVLAQRQAVTRLREEGRRQRDQWQPLVLKLMELGQADELAQRLRRMVAAWRTLSEGESELAAFQQFRYEIGSAGSFLAQLDEMRDLPQRLDRLLRELGRYRHLLGHPRVQESSDPGLAVRIEALGAPPTLDQPDAVESWLRDAAAVHEEWKLSYSRAHDAWWRKQSELELWKYEPPLLARSRHLGLEATLKELAQIQDQAGTLRCRGLSNLDYQPLCVCGFDGTTHPFAKLPPRFAELRRALEDGLRQLFAKEEVRTRLRQWITDGLETNPTLLAYLEGHKPLPEVASIELLDRYLAGVAVVREIETASLDAVLAERTWEPQELVQAFAQWVEGLGAQRLRLHRTPPSDAKDVRAWCLEQSLRQGAPLPKGLGVAASPEEAASLRPEWLSASALEHLDSLGLGDAAIDRILVWITEGQITPPAATSLPDPVAAARELSAPSIAATPADLGQLAARLYGQHHRLVRLARDPWLARLDAVADTALESTPPLLTEALQEHADAQWLLVDALGWPLLATLEPELRALAGSAPTSTGAALASPQTTTDACYAELARADISHAILKIDAIDTLLHEAFMPFEDLRRRARAELEIATRKLRPRLDPARPLLIFADHGFRISPDGRSYQHGGPSTLERLVPLLRFDP